MSAVGRTAHHHVLAVDLSGEHNAVSVEGEVCVLKLCEGLEIVGVSDTDGRLPAVSVAPCYNVLVFELANSGVVAVLPLSNLGDIALKVDSLLVDVPVDTVLGEANVKLHVSLSVVNSENACELVVAVLERYNGAVEDGVGRLSVAVSLLNHDLISLNDRVSTVSPYNVSASLGLFHPGDIGHGYAVYNLCFHYEIRLSYLNLFSFRITAFFTVI